MWQSPNARVKAIQQQRDRQKNRRTRPIHLKRVVADLTLKTAPNQPLETRMMLNDMTPKGVTLFTHQNLEQGQEITLTIHNPRNIQIRGRVVWSQPTDNAGHIIAPKQFGYRSGILFLFDQTMDQQTIADFLTEVQKTGLFTRNPTF